MKIGSMFSGIGGLDLATEAALGGELTWAVEREPHCVKVLERHWPDAEVISQDVRGVNPSTLAAVDVLCGGFPCTDLSVSGNHAGLDGENSGLYHEVLRFAEALQPEWLVMENVPGVLKYRDRIDADLGRLGYGAAWVKIAASDVGAPQWRKRVFIVAQRGADHAGIVSEYGSTGPDPRWPTPMARDWKCGAVGEEVMARGGRPLSEVARWPTPTKSIGTGGQTSRSGKRRGELLLGGAVRERWPTHTAGDTGERLPGRLNPDWVETLQGFPVGWSQPEGFSQYEDGCHLTDGEACWPMGRGLEQYDWEPPRLLTGPPTMGRPARLRALGNAVVPAQGYAAVLLGKRALVGKRPGRQMELLRVEEGVDRDSRA